jgi:hypothetical protein
MMLAESFLHRVQMAVSSKTLNRGDLSTVERDGERCATLDRAAIDMNYARTALARIAAHMRAR